MLDFQIYFESMAGAHLTDAVRASDGVGRVISINLMVTRPRRDGRTGRVSNTAPPLNEIAKYHTFLSTS